MIHEQPDAELMVRLDPQDACTARTAGVEFARALTGSPPEWFILALNEQEDIIRDGIRQAGYSARQARLAADAFQIGARVEWTRLASTATEAWGSA